MGKTIITIILCLLVSTCVSKCKVDSYNRATGKNISLWDGMWLDLRVESPAK